jgi:hypothetical protein
MRILLLFGALLAWHATALAQRTPIDPPVAGRPTDFSNIVGKYDIKAAAEPTAVQVEGVITLRIEIVGSGPAQYEPARKQLRIFPESWQSDFYVQDMTDKDEVQRDKKTWLFVYRLKPKHANIDAINDIKLVYFDPDKRDRDKFETKYARSIKITVTPKPDKTTEIVVQPAAVPDSFLECIESRQVLEGGPTTFAISGWQFALFLAAPPFGCVIGFFVWRRCFPHETEVARRFRKSAAARAMNLLRTGDVAAWTVVHRYLRERFRFAVEDPTPAEIAGFLKRLGFAKTLSEQGRAFFRASDAVRFADAEPKQLTDAARDLIQALEADPCVSA